ncbi:MAG: cytochrome c maturation protein CcmE [Bacteroidetes bacterium]|nr:cytochrome c maturation protein CcmE [Bacteroidota bacterium]MBK8145805.1 cytochrome c maturation protein CcmE [Bacteroidota bacterium]MBP6315346.1 cytochrome c maturation protein CcmE [Chitinophagaceae bacterium]
MKKIHIVVLLVVAGVLAAIVSMVGDFSSYQTFATAEAKPGKEFQIIAKLDTTVNPMYYNPIEDPNHFTFYAKDEAGLLKKVVFNGTKPQDFERSERLTMTGTMQNGEFKCNKILMKCPSKYKNDQIVVGNAS